MPVRSGLAHRLVRLAAVHSFVGLAGRADMALQFLDEPVAQASLFLAGPLADRATQTRHRI